LLFGERFLIKPNFFFVGAPKCGTTSITYRLSQHPNVFISNPKEPHFFEKEIPRGIKSLKKYESLFLKAKKLHKIVGEASTGYLYSHTAIPEILSYSPNAKFLVSVRNPYEMAISLHAQALRGRYEDQHDFSTAWKLQTIRRLGSNIPKSCSSSLLLIYEDRCALGDQIERLFNVVATNKVCLVFFDDLKNNPVKLYNKIYNFLEVPHDSNPKFPVLNQRKHIRWPFLTSVTQFLGKTKIAMGINQSLGIADWFVKITSTNQVENTTIDNDVWKDMDDKFIPQIKKIEYFSDIDLSHWYYYRNIR
jgi:hypothetical protein